LTFTIIYWPQTPFRHKIDRSTETVTPLKPRP